MEMSLEKAKHEYTAISHSGTHGLDFGGKNLTLSHPVIPPLKRKEKSNTFFY